MIKLSIEIPTFGEEEMKDSAKLLQIITTLKQYCDELASKATSQQENPRTTAPTITELDEGEIVAYENGGDRRLYTKLNGSIRYASLT